jgi:hypothetical protein
MNITPKTGPANAAELNKAAQQAQQETQSAKARAIASFNNAKGNTSQPVPNASQVSPEEMGAITNDLGQNTSDVAPPVDAPTPKEEQKKPEDPISTQYAVLARKEKALRAKVQAQEQAMRAKEAALTAKEQEFKTREQEYQSKFISKDRLQQDPISVFNELGLTYDQITNAAMNAPKPEDVERMREMNSLKAEIKALKDAQENSTKSYQEQQTKGYQQALNQIRQETQALVQNDPAFETIKETNSVGDVVELIEKTFNEDGILLTVEEASQQVEDYLLEEAMKIMKIKKIQERLKPVQSGTAPQKQQSNQAANQPQSKTLTNSMGASRQLSARERAILAFKGEKQ